MNNDKTCECERCQLTRKFEAICQKLGKRDREWMLADRQQLAGYCMHLESMMEDIMDAAQEPRAPKQLPRRGDERRRR